MTNALYGADSDFTSMVKTVESWAHVEVGSAQPKTDEPKSAVG